jgi:hypothetical protein
MKNMQLKKISLLVISMLFSGILTAQLKNSKLKMPESNLRIVKMGPFIGLEKGKYLNVHFGGERQWQEIKLVQPKTYALNIQFDYNYTNNVIGSEIGAWFKAGRLNMTYGARINWFNDFNGHSRYGCSPNVGYKFMQGHFQLGVNLLSPSDYVRTVNTFYASLRWVFINDRDIKK